MKIIGEDGWPTRIYDAKGRYQGRISEESNGGAVIYDAYGKFQGRIKK